MVHNSAFLNNIKNRIKGVPKKSKKGNIFRGFSGLSKITTIYGPFSIFFGTPYIRIFMLLCIIDIWATRIPELRCFKVLVLKWWAHKASCFLEKCTQNTLFWKTARYMCSPFLNQYFTSSELWDTCGSYLCIT